MGYTARSLGVVPDFAKIVLSLWFNIPAASIENAAAATGEFFGAKLPLVVFGAKEVETVYGSTATDVLEWHSTPPGPGLIQTVWDVSPSDELDLPPCYIALDCSGEEPTLEINIQTKTNPAVTQARLYIGHIDGWADTDPEQPPADVVPGNGAFPGNVGPLICDIPTDASYVDSAQPALFRIRNNTAITPDVWHHVLLSFDLTDGASAVQVTYPSDAPETTADQTSAWSKCYLAVDDVNQVGEDGLGPNSWLDGGGDNDVVPWSPNYTDVFSVAGGGNSLLFFDWETGPATYDLVSPVVGEGHVGVPTIADYDTENFRVRIADLQIFTGVSFDTSVEANRRVFIRSDGKPASPTLAAALLGKQPEVRFQTPSDWQGGNNRGTSGEFTPTGTITSFAGVVDL